MTSISSTDSKIISKGVSSWENKVSTKTGGSATGTQGDHKYIICTLELDTD